MYKFEKDIERNMMSMDVVDARRFGVAVREAMRVLEREALCYKLTNEQYYLDTQIFLRKMAERLEAPHQQEEHLQEG